MTDPWKDGARTEAPRASRLRLVLVLIAALLVPLLIVGLGSHQSIDVVEVASASATDASLAATVAVSVELTIADTVAAEEADAPLAPRKPTTGEWIEPTTAAPTTEAPATTAAPTTTGRPAATSTTAKPQVKAQAAPTTAAPAPPPTTSAPAVTSAPQSGTAADLAFLACVRKRESGGNYQIVSANGMYYGAYQFLRSTWDNAANIAGRPDLVGLAPNTVAPADQDAVALAYYHAVGSSPWGGPCYG
jgi:hypothetical protein